MSVYGKLLNPNRSVRVPLGIKAERKYHSITHNPSTINSGQTLYVRVPKLNQGILIVPGTLKLTFDLERSGGHANNHFVNNVGRAIVDQMQEKLGGETLSNIQHYGPYKVYCDLWLSKDQRKNKVMQGLGSESLRKHRSGLAGSGKDTAIKDAFGVRYSIPLDFDIYNNHGPFYPWCINEDFVTEITFSEPKYLITASDDAANMGYSVKNIAIEYETVQCPELARQIESDYVNGITFFYDHVTHFKSQNTGSEKSLNINVNIPRRSMKGILVFFEAAFDDGEYDPESTPFQNPKITNTLITIEGISNQIYAQGYNATQQWDEIQRHFLRNPDSNMDIESFYNDKFALWIDMRSTKDNRLHGSGYKLMNTNDGVQIAITRTNTTAYTMHIFVVSDAQLTIKNRQLQNVLF